MRKHDSVGSDTNTPAMSLIGRYQGCNVYGRPIGTNHPPVRGIRHCFPSMFRFLLKTRYTHVWSKAYPSPRSRLS